MRPHAPNWTSRGNPNVDQQAASRNVTRLSHPINWIRIRIVPKTWKPPRPPRQGPFFSTEASLERIRDSTVNTVATLQPDCLPSARSVWPLNALSKGLSLIRFVCGEYAGSPSDGNPVQALRSARFAERVAHGRNAPSHFSRLSLPATRHRVGAGAVCHLLPSGVPLSRLQ